MRRTLSRVRFFKPTTSFIRWLAEYAGDRIIIEVGAGDCNLSIRLRAVGAKALAIDPTTERTIETMTFLLQMCAHEAKVVRDHPALIVSARPDHGGWVGEIPGYMHPESEMLYIGLIGNVEQDIGGLTRTAVAAPRTGSHDVVLSLRSQPADLDFSKCVDQARGSYD